MMSNSKPDKTLSLYPLTYVRACFYVQLEFRANMMVFTRTSMTVPDSTSASAMNYTGTVVHKDCCSTEGATYVIYHTMYRNVINTISTICMMMMERHNKIL